MELKCRHTEWEACPKCLDFQQRKTKKELNGVTSPVIINKIVNEVICCKPWCRKKIPIEFIDNHTKVCKRPRSKKSTICSQCQKQFSKVSNLNRHIATVHSVLRKYVCVNCSRSYYDPGKLDKHLQRCNYNTHLSRKHSIVGDEKLFSSDDEEGDFHDDADILHVQPEDNLPSMVSIRKNITLENDQNCNAAPKMKKMEDSRCVKISTSLFNNKLSKSRNQINNDMKILKMRKRKSTVCSHCGKQFSRVSNLNRHVRTVHGVKIYCCKQCNKSYAFAEKLNIHLRTMHPELNSLNLKIDQKHDNHPKSKVLIVDKILANKSTIGQSNGSNNKHRDVNEPYYETNTVFVLDNLTMSNVNGNFSTNGEICNGNTNYDFLQKEEENFDSTSVPSVTIVNPVCEDKGIDNDDSGSNSLNGNTINDSDTNEDSFHETTTSFPYATHKQSIKKKTVPCQHCNKQFSKVSNLNRHIFDVHNIRFNCENCSKSFSNMEKLEKHCRNKCNPDKNYKLLKADTALPCMVIDEIFH